MRQSATSTTWRPGLALLLATSVSVATHVWLARGLLVPIARGPHVEHLFVSAPPGSFVAVLVLSLAAVFGTHAFVRRLASRLPGEPPLFAPGDADYARPLLCLAASALGLLSLVPAVVGFPRTWLYLIVDLRWWWVPLVLAWVACGLDARLHGTLRERLARVRPPAAVRPWVAGALVVAVATMWVVAGTPHLRSGRGTVGDEPKYIRFCENLYQGRGFAMTNIQPMARLRDPHRPSLSRNLRLVERILPGELRSLAADAAAFVAHPTRRFNRARYLDTGRIVGKTGDVYQRYNPGVSFLMLPAYVVDRRSADVHEGSNAQFPDVLPTVRTLLLVLYAAWAVVIFRFLGRYVAVPAVASIATLALVLTLPAAAFPFQYYPEVAAGLFVSLVGARLLAGDRGGAVSWFAHGLLAGYLPWFHVRFSALSAVFIVAAVVLERRSHRRAAAFVAGAAVPLAGLALYAYRITGSILPTALWYTDGAGALLSAGGAVRSSAAYLLDRNWGLFSHSPVYLLALAGFWPMRRRHPRTAWLCAAVLFGLLVPAAAHTLDAAGTTPLRLVVAVLPFAATPLVAFLAEYGGRRPARVAFGALLVLSLQNALAYNLHQQRGTGIFVDSSFSGWKVNLLFPFESRWPWTVSAANGALVVLWAVVCLALLVAPALPRWRRPPRASDAHAGLRAWSTGQLGLAAAVLLVALGTGVSAATGVSWNPRYLVPEAAAARAAVLQIEETAGRAVSVSSIRGRVDNGTLRAELERLDPSP